MNEALIAVFVIAIVVLIAISIHVIEHWGKCRHKFGMWSDESTDEAYAQWRSCIKCGYIDREQWRKIKDKP
jgi:uncharacterized membrane protein